LITWLRPGTEKSRDLQKSMTSSRLCGAPSPHCGWKAQSRWDCDYTLRGLGWSMSWSAARGPAEL